MGLLEKFLICLIAIFSIVESGCLEDVSGNCLQYGKNYNLKVKTSCNNYESKNISWNKNGIFDDIKLMVTSSKNQQECTRICKEGDYNCKATGVVESGSQNLIQTSRLEYTGLIGPGPTCIRAFVNWAYDKENIQPKRKDLLKINDWGSYKHGNYFKLKHVNQLTNFIGLKCSNNEFKNRYLQNDETYFGFEAKELQYCECTNCPNC